MAAEEKDPNDPSTTSEAFDSMVPSWLRADALLGGTDAMREAGQMYLPQHAEETGDNYADRLNSNVLFNVYDLTLDMLTGKPFSRPVHLNDDVPDSIRDLKDDIDLQGNNVTTVARELFRIGLAKAFCHLMIEFPRTIEYDEDGEPVRRSVADDLRQKPRPYWKVVYPDSVIFMDSEVVNGQTRLTHVRIQEGHFERQGFAEKWVEQIRVLEPGVEKVYELRKTQTKREEWVVVDEFRTGIDFIPMLTFYTDYAGCGRGVPPLDDLAHLNIRHWQSNADQINILTVSRFPMLGASGISEKMKNELSIGPRTLLVTREPNGRYYYVEPTGRSIEAGRKDLDALERQMVSYGAQFLKDQPDRPVASGRILDSAEATSMLRECVVRLENTLQQALAMTARWLREEDGGTATVNKEFELQTKELSDLISIRASGDLSYEDFMEELKIRGGVSERFDADKNKERIDKEKADADTENNDDDNADDDEPET